MEQLREKLNPFPGLRSFEPDEDHLFFGRDTQVDELLSRLGRTRFLAVMGASGSGKSSLVRSGLIPSLYSGYMTKAGSSWRVAIFRPGRDPIGNLAAALNDPAVLGGEVEDAAMNRSLIEATLHRSARGLGESVRQARLPEHDSVLVVADQFEELFRFKDNRRIKDSRESALAFVNLLLEGARYAEAPVYVVLTMRSDFIGNCTEFPGLVEAINDGQYLVPRMSRDERRQAIVGPVAVGGAEVSPRLVTRLLNDVGDDPDQLPILQHSLMRAWDYWQAHHTDGEALDLRHYEAIGTMEEALSLHAEEAYRELEDERSRRICELLFRGLTERGTDGRGVRRPLRFADALTLTGASAEELTAVIERFRQPGRTFLMPAYPVPLGPDSIIDVSHESLMRTWKRLIQWVDEEARSAQIYLRLSQNAARYQEGKAALYRDPELQMALNWRDETQPTAVWAERYDPAFERAMLFLEYSEKERDFELAEKERQRQRQLLWARRLIAILSMAAVVTLLFGIYAMLQQAEADEARAEAVDNLAQAEAERLRTEEERRRAEEERLRAEEEKQRAEQASQEALTQKELAEANERRASDNAARALAAQRAAQKNEEEARRAREEAEQEQRRAEQEKLRAEAEKQRAELSEAQAKRLQRQALARALAIQSQRYAQDEAELGALLARQAYRLNRDNGGNPEAAHIYTALRVAVDRLNPEEPIELRHHDDAVRSLTMAEGRGILASGSDDGSVKLVDLGGSEAPRELLARPGPRVRSVALSDGGGLLAAGDFDGKLHWWDMESGDAPTTIGAHNRPIAALAFRPGGRELASGSAGDGVKLWELTARPPRGEALPRSQGASVGALSWSGDGRRLAVAAQGGGLLVWNLDRSGAPPLELSPGEVVQAVAFHPANDLLASGDKRGAIRLWRLDGSAAELESELLGHQSPVSALAFSRTGLLTSASLDRSVRLWDTGRSDAEPVVLQADDWVWTVAFSRDGERLAAGDNDGVIRVWDTRTEPLAREICRLVDRDLTEEEWQDHLGELDYESTCPQTTEGS